jgi:hypothetical protein
MPGGITPDGSVKWFVEGDEYSEKKLPNGKVRLEGRDATEKNQFFEITIKHPSRPDNRALFLLQLQQHVFEAVRDKSVNRLTVYMPVEDRQSGYPVPSEKSATNYRPSNRDQWSIYIDWSLKLSDIPRKRLQKWLSRRGQVVK